MGTTYRLDIERLERIVRAEGIEGISSKTIGKRLGFVPSVIVKALRRRPDLFEQFRDHRIAKENRWRIWGTAQ